MLFINFNFSIWIYLVFSSSFNECLNNFIQITNDHLNAFQNIANIYQQIISNNEIEQQALSKRLEFIEEKISYLIFCRLKIFNIFTDINELEKEMSVNKENVSNYDENQEQIRKILILENDIYLQIDNLLTKFEEKKRIYS
ncbi:hypothetical protein EHP00_964 [Ecytonucleospora hepatopenaei]|uniref:Uncharacterized protein n=1 Tax=Ecytonucleospora hepatopenaei TaxID=646526 RepID=A0A1W0E6P1_9MICR|nr:hypothetical protein EHP00_964 [Ecytonucleospora hepatopenaei]